MLIGKSSKQILADKKQILADKILANKPKRKFAWIPVKTEDSDGKYVWLEHYYCIETTIYTHNFLYYESGDVPSISNRKQTSRYLIKPGHWAEREIHIDSWVKRFLEDK